MAGGFIHGLQFGNAIDIGSNVGTSAFTGLATGAAFTKGSYVQLIASTSADIAWMTVLIDSLTMSGFAAAVDIGIGTAGSETTIVNNLCMNASASPGVIFTFPLAIKSGTRIAARASSNSASDSVPVHLNVFDDTAMSAPVGSGIDTYGFSAAANDGTAVDPGATANTKGTYAQITASLTNDIVGFFLSIDGQGHTTGTAGVFISFIDIAIGGSGSEQVILPNFGVAANVGSSGPLMHPLASPYFAIPIKSGTRVAARASAGTNISPDRILGLTFYGVRQ